MKRDDRGHELMNVGNLIAMPLCLALLTGCTTMAQKTWEKRKASKEFLSEKEIFKKRLGGKSPCPSTGLNTLTWNISIAPSMECIYPETRFKYEPFDGGMVSEVQYLNVLQTTQDGFLVTTARKMCTTSRCYEETSPNILYIHKTNETGIVDGMQLNQHGSGNSLYEYTGPYSYQTNFGPKTVHSFRKLPNDALSKAGEGLKIYDVNQEMYANLEAWPFLEDAMQKENQPKK